MKCANKVCSSGAWFRNRWIGLAAVFLVVQAVPEAEARNTRSYMLGDEAAMTGGAGVAVSSDSGSLWYNPAGLGGLELGRMELTGTVIRPNIAS